MRHLILIVLLLLAGPAQAHFLTDAQSRELHLVAEGAETHLILRKPLTFAYAAELAQRSGFDSVIEAPFLIPELISGRPFYRFDTVAFGADPAGFLAFMLRDTTLSQHGQVLAPEIRRMRLVRLAPGAAPPSGLDRLRQELAAPADPAAAEGAYVSELTLIAELAWPGLAPAEPLTIDIAGPGFAVPETLHFATLAVDHRGPAQDARVHDDFWPPRMVFEGVAPPLAVRLAAPVLPLAVVPGAALALFGLFRLRRHRNAQNLQA